MRRTTGERATAGPAAVLAAAGLWGTVGPAQVLAGSELGPSAIGGWRLIVGGLLLGALSLYRSPVRRGLRTWQVWGWILAAALATGVYQASFLASVNQLGAALATAVALGCAPVATGLLAVWLASETLDRRWFVGGGLSIVGCAVLLVPGGGATAVDAGGLALGVMSGVCYGAYTVAAKRLSWLDVDPGSAVALTLLLGAVFLLPRVAAEADGVTDGSTLALIVWIGVGATGLAYALFVAGLRNTDASTAGVLALAEPLVAAVLGLVVLGEHLTLPQTLGALILLTGVVAAATSSRTPSPPPLRRALA